MEVLSKVRYFKNRKDINNDLELLNLRALLNALVNCIIFSLIEAALLLSIFLLCLVTCTILHYLSIESIEIGLISINIFMFGLLTLPVVFIIRFIYIYYKASTGFGTYLRILGFKNIIETQDNKYTISR